MQLQNKTAIITGGGTGIGQAIAKAFAQAGANVVITGRRLDKLNETVAAIGGENPVHAYAVDVADREEVNKLAGWATERFGQVDILVNNAGVNVVKRQVAELEPDAWDYILAVGATGVFNTVHAILPQMRARQDGLIILISSLAGVRPAPLGGAAYSAAKHAANAFMKVLSVEEKDNGIRATIIAPGEVNTPLLDDRPVKVSDEHKARILQPADVAAAAIFVASLPPHAHVPELLIKPVTQLFV
ncbi:MAG: SDR family NAD(P)-dependent oxidoreductase [Caldilineaceae bacterium]|nr:SDR family NAD(P)-dependent oxidoreductase [Caldilineaceae bacterium]